MSAVLPSRKAKTFAKPNSEETSHEQVGYFKEFTVAVFGDSGVGKSSIIRQLVGEEYVHDHLPTVEEFYVKQITHKNNACELLSDFPTKVYLCLATCFELSVRLGVNCSFSKCLSN